MLFSSKSFLRPNKLFPPDVGLGGGTEITRFDGETANVFRCRTEDKKSPVAFISDNVASESDAKNEPIPPLLCILVAPNDNLLFGLATEAEEIFIRLNLLSAEPPSVQPLR
mmetsp:Transcript_9232/g.12759  ORF Transcript_9232/g.12759 Transcript_9232/m.12759 type:complete len:111 (+) Transcript_9232:327-659(+)